ncbi:MAG: hypothetical protein GW946_01185 [Candidatus Pacebacteria bacterium]|nr:hypothetical protein [Candidatus Paceibacterota bacterium]PIR60800.1 MAG: hypothetical protein COU67_00755 [Candidatus Pacebacteria bacterium CG10_big_fil_rev_8_21_14_0_10_44_54]
MDIHTEIANQVTRQSYQQQAKIDGVEFVPTPVMQDDGGYFVELARLETGLLHVFSQPITVKQVSLSHMSPGVIKAYHLHHNQTDVWFAPPESSLLVNLHDVRAGSPTYQTHMRFMLGGTNTKLLAIPPGVAHGVANLGAVAANLIYYTSEQFDKADPDEFRLSWDQFGADVWEMTKG